VVLLGLGVRYRAVITGQAASKEVRWSRESES
jgi:hypothetical protein